MWYLLSKRYSLIMYFSYLRDSCIADYTIYINKPIEIQALLKTERPSKLRALSVALPTLPIKQVLLNRNGTRAIHKQFVSWVQSYETFCPGPFLPWVSGHSSCACDTVIIN